MRPLNRAITTLVAGSLIVLAGDFIAFHPAVLSKATEEIEILDTRRIFPKQVVMVVQLLGAVIVLVGFAELRLSRRNGSATPIVMTKFLTRRRRLASVLVFFTTAAPLLILPQTGSQTHFNYVLANWKIPEDIVSADLCVLVVSALLSLVCLLWSH